MKSRNLAVRLAVVVSSAFALAAVGPALGTAPAAADMNVEGLKPPAIPEIPEPSEVTPPEPFEFTIEKLQEIAGSGRGFTKSPLIGAIGETVDYEIIVTNTGIEPLALSEFSDEHCDTGTLAGGPGQALLAVGASTTYTCTRVLSSEGRFTNEATVMGTPPNGLPMTHTSNQVEVVVPPHAGSPASPSALPAPAAAVGPAQAAQGVEPCKASAPAVRLPSGPKRGPFTVR